MNTDIDIGLILMKRSWQNALGASAIKQTDGQNPVSGHLSSNKRNTLLSLFLKQVHILRNSVSRLV